jgi:hypothetical protein
MGKRLRSALVPGIALGLVYAALLLVGWPADPAASSSFCPLAAPACSGEGKQVEIDPNVISFRPTKLPKRKPAPVHLGIDMTIGVSDGSNPPPLRELVLEIDKNAALDVQGLPTCGLKKIKTATTSQALKACRPALVGEGKTNVEVAYPEQSPLLPWSKLLAFDGGVRGGKETIYIHSYLVAPVSAPVVMTARVSKIPKGRFRTKLAISVPPIAKGSGFVRKFQLDLFRLFAHKGRKRSFLKARCFDGKLLARATLAFFEAPPVTSTFVLPCTAKG